MELNELVKSSHGNAVSKGFYDLPKSILDKMRMSLFSLEEINAVKDAFIGQRLMLITSELGEALEANRKKRNAKDDVGSMRVLNEFIEDDRFVEYFKTNVKDTFEDELADVQIRLADLSGWLDIPLEEHTKAKARYNSTREHMHGKQY